MSEFPAWCLFLLGASILILRPLVRRSVNAYYGLLGVIFGLIVLLRPPFCLPLLCIPFFILKIEESEKWKKLRAFLLPVGGFVFIFIATLIYTWKDIKIFQYLSWNSNISSNKSLVTSLIEGLPGLVFNWSFIPILICFSCVFMLTLIRESRVQKKSSLVLGGAIAIFVFLLYGPLTQAGAAAYPPRAILLNYYILIFFSIIMSLRLMGAAIDKMPPPSP
jgi:4-amino-4-deoxy-L-arabinose transferase-like glycosyltransferase